jgi:hypothetical protein
MRFKEGDYIISKIENSIYDLKHLCQIIKYMENYEEETYKIRVCHEFYSKRKKLNTDTYCIILNKTDGEYFLIKDIEKYAKYII